MSKENVTAFWTKLQQDQELRRRLESLPSGSREEMVAGLVRIGSEQGLPFTAEEFGQTANLSPVGLGEQDLAGVAGGLLSDRFTSRLTLQFPTFRLSGPKLF